MSWQTTSDPDEFVAAVGTYLRRRRDLHTIELTALERLRAAGTLGTAGDEPLFGWWWSPSTVVEGTFMVTPPWPMLLADAPAAAVDALAGLLAERRRGLPGVNASPATARRFADGWRRRTRESAALHRHQRLYRLTALTRPEPEPPGRPRVAGPADRELLLAWSEAFLREVNETPKNLVAGVDDRLTYGGYTLWEVDGSPVALAGATREAAGMVRVGPVYTPPQHRRRGYGGAATAEVSQAALDAGTAEVLLFTELDNPTSNALYQRLGYRAVADRTVLLFTATPADAASGRPDA